MIRWLLYGAHSVFVTDLVAVLIPFLFGASTGTSYAILAVCLHAFFGIGAVVWMMRSGFSGYTRIAVWQKNLFFVHAILNVVMVVLAIIAIVFARRGNWTLIFVIVALEIVLIVISNVIWSGLLCSKESKQIFSVGKPADDGQVLLAPMARSALPGTPVGVVPTVVRQSNPLSSA
jgi:FlaA1/EpsC-like NDP-sugar epimerase